MRWPSWFRRDQRQHDSAHKDEAVVRRLFTDLEKEVRSASIAEVGGFRPSLDPLTSRFSGDFVMLEDEDWPTWSGKPLQSFLQINIADLPFVPDSLRTFKLITVFVDENVIPFDTPNGEGWVVRTYDSLSGLCARDNPVIGSLIRSFEIRWTRSDNEWPDWDDIVMQEGFDDFNALEDSIDIFYDRINHHLRTKVGGWPSLIQSSLQFSEDEFVFQIGSEEKANWHWIDAGTAYFGLSEGQWKFECQFS